MIRNIAWIAALAIAVLMTGLVFLLPQPEIEPDASAEASTELLIENVRLLENGQRSAPQSVVVRDGLIHAIGAVTASADAEVIDGAGGTLLPGLIDSHTHSYGSSLADALRFGVTVNLDMFTDPSVLLPARQARAQRDAAVQADLWSAGMLATAPGGHGTQFGVPVQPLDQAEEIPAWVADRKAEGSDYIKLVYMPKARAVPSLDRTLARAVIEAAHAEGLMAVAHISTLTGARHMIEDGIDGLVHVFADELADEPFIELARSRDVFIIPTLAVIEAVDSDQDGFSRMGMSAQDELLSPMQQQTLAGRFGADILGFQLKTALENVRRLHAGGVRILAGSDAPNPGTAQGISLHRELQLLVQAGLDEAEAIAAATARPARAFGLEDRGRIAVGARADLVLVDGDPLADISRTLAIREIIKNGHPVPRTPGETDRSPVLETELLGDFELGLNAPAGFAWTSTDDGMVNGASEVSIERFARTDSDEDDGDHALRITATVRRGFPFPWAGGALMSSAGGDVSGFRAVQFDLRGTPGDYRLMAFNVDAVGIPPTVNLRVGEDWETHTVAFEDLQGLEPGRVMGFAWVAGPEPGESTLYLDNVRLVK